MVFSDAFVDQLAELTDLWDAPAVLDVVAESVGLDGWDFQPPPAPVGMTKAAVAAGLIDEPVAASRRGKRCGVVMPRAQARCIRRAGHPGPHRAR